MSHKEESNQGAEFDKDLVRQKLREGQQQLKVRKIEGQYEFDNPDLEEKSMTPRTRKTKKFEEIYKDKPKIAFHELDDDGNRLFMQAKRDKVWTTLGWSFVGNFAGLLAVGTMETTGRFSSFKFMKRNEMTKAAVFLGCVGMFTLYGYGNARQAFVNAKRDIVKEHSIASTEK